MVVSLCVSWLFVERPQAWHWWQPSHLQCGFSRDSPALAQEAINHGGKQPTRARVPNTGVQEGAQAQDRGAHWCPTALSGRSLKVGLQGLTEPRISADQKRTSVAVEERNGGSVRRLIEHS